MEKRTLHIETNIRLLSPLLEDLRSGKLQIPPFQREFVWTREKIKQLFESISQNYPIGSLILWKPAQDMGWINRSDIGSFEIPSIEGKGVYILDGYQRVSSIFGCLTNPEKSSLNCNKDTWQSLFSLYYDLEDESFFYLRTGAYPLPCQVPVHILMSTSDFRQYSRKHIENSGIETEIVDRYLDRADAISGRLLSYQVACIEITNANIEEAVDIFARINSRGTDISFDWMVNALSYDKDNFKFADLIDHLQEDLRQYNFDGISRNTLFRCYQSAFGKLYIDQTDIETLAKRSDFPSVANSLGQYILRAVRFLHDDLKVIEYKLLPYPMQLIFIMEFFRQIHNPTEKQLEDLKGWFWKTTYSNYYTINSLTNQRKAYEHFLKYLRGGESDILYSENHAVRDQTLGFPTVVRMDAVRNKALVLFCLNHLYGEQVPENDTYQIIRIMPKLPYSPANTIIYSSRQPDKDVKEILRNMQKEVLDRTDDMNNLLGKLFLSEAAIVYIRHYKDKEFLAQRERDIMDAEERFVQQLGMSYIRAKK